MAQYWKVAQRWFLCCQACDFEPESLIFMSLTQAQPKAWWSLKSKNPSPPCSKIIRWFFTKVSERRSWMSELFKLSSRNLAMQYLTRFESWLTKDFITQSIFTKVILSDFVLANSASMQSCRNWICYIFLLSKNFFELNWTIKILKGQSLKNELMYATTVKKTLQITKFDN